MPDNDSTIQALPSLSAPTLQDFLLAADTSDSYEPKKLPLDKLMELILSSSTAFDVQGSTLCLKQNMDAGGNKIINLPGASNPGDAVPYIQISPLIKALDYITPGAPSASDRGSFIRITCPTIVDPFGGFYLFYWCLDSSPSPQITLSGSSVVASSGATINFDGSVANIVNSPKDPGMQNSYFHVAVRYRNFNYLSNLSATAHLLINKPVLGDIFKSQEAPPPRNFSFVAENNRLYVNAEPGPDTPPGCSYIAEILFDSSDKTEITGTESGLLRISSSIPSFSYDVPLMQSQSPRVHARIASVSMHGLMTFTDTLHCELQYDANFINEEFLDLMARKMSDMIQTQAGEPLTVK